jgi:UDP-2,3-diacylglucosamine pyrophosphatase LpxH
MSGIKLIISDLHLADGHAILDSFGDFQQAALEGLLAATGTPGPWGRADDIELIINGDCFDFLATAPYDTGGVSNVVTAMEKLNKIKAAHGAFFETLRQFIGARGRHVTFITGNHDMELQFEEVRGEIARTIVGEQAEGRVVFCPTRFYHPLRDVYVEHGNAYDFWNAPMSGLWDEHGQPEILRDTQDDNRGTILLPVGSHYFQHAAHPISIRYAYFDRFEPSMNTMRQLALLCLLNPEIVIETAKLTMDLFSQPRRALSGLAEGEERVPEKLFEHTILDFVAFQQEMAARKGDGVEPGEEVRNGESEVEANHVTEFAMLQEVLKLPLVEAVAAICTPTTYHMGEGVAAGMHAVLHNDAQLRYAIAGHTHMVRIETVGNGAQSYLNTGSWTTRLALPAPGEVNATLVEWLREPDWERVPLRDVTQLIFALIRGEADEKQVQQTPSSATLCVWEGGRNGSYKVLA